MDQRKGIRGWPILRGRLKADAVIVGGGLTGLSIALWLGRAGLRTVVVEAKSIGGNISGSCCGVLSPACGLIYAELEKKQGIKTSQAYAQTHLKAFQSICELSSDARMNFPIRKMRGAILAAKGQTDKLEEEAEAMKRAGIDAAIETDKNMLSFMRLSFDSVYLLNPDRYLHALAEQARFYTAQIFEGSRVTAVETDAVYTERGSVQAPFVVIATGFPIVNTPGWFFARLEQRKQEVFRLSGGQKQRDVFFSSDHAFTCIPDEDDVLLRIEGGLVGVRRENNHEKIVREISNKIGAQRIEHVKTFVQTHTPDGLPYIGSYSSKTPNLFAATGYGGDGLTGSMIAAQAIAAQILGLPSNGYEIYLPQRGIRGMAVPAHIAGRYLKGMFAGAEAPRCSHMGCKLVYNPVSRLWECPCHGSRFDDIGRVLNAPATHPALLRGRK